MWNKDEWRILDAMINARSLAVVGASEKPMKFGSLFLKSQLDFGFKGRIYPVNPGESEIFGLPCYPSLSSLPEVPELVYVAIPAHRALQALEESASLGVKGVVILASGFREAGPEGRELEKRALELARKGGFRIIGPNCFGIYNPRNGLTLLPGHDFSREEGDIAFISQSGGYAAHVGRLGRDLGLRFRAIVSYGNACDVDESDLLEYFALDEGTSAVACYLEGTSDGRRFFEVLKHSCSMKPVVVWKVGRSEVSARAVVSHTGSMAGSPEVWKALIRQCGAADARGVEETCGILSILRHLGPNPGRRILFIGGGGGLGTWAADLAEEAGLVMPSLESETERRLRALLGYPGASVGNPLDIGTPAVPPHLFGEILLTASADPGIDVVLFDMALNFAYQLVGEGVREMASLLRHAAEDTEKAMVAVIYNRAQGPDDLGLERTLREIRSYLHQGGVPTFTDVAEAIGCLARANNFHRLSNR